VNPKPILPRQALNKAYLKAKPTRIQIEQFKAQLTTLLEHTNAHESEEHHKNLVSDFLKKTYYDPHYFINTKDRKDLVIHTGSKPDSTVGVIIEAKKPTNKSEMPTRENLNAKAFHELLYYYLQERITHNNLELKHLIITNIHEWYIFDAHRFETLFAQNKKLIAQFNDFVQGRLGGSSTDFFYKEIATSTLAALDQELPFTYLDIRDFEKPLRNQDPKDDGKLIVLYKILSPAHLLKLPFENDSNSLDRKFYSELLHIIGLTETKDGGKKVIGRHTAKDRLPGSLLENTISQLDTLDKLSRLEKPSQFGTTIEERQFNIGLELTITWINRILFLKLLEAQLIVYHKGDKSYAFLHPEKVGSYDDLEGLFFQVLARRYDERSGDLKARFAKVPYLNSSLFEPTDLEHLTLSISNLRDDRPIPVHGSTVLKDVSGHKLTGTLDTLRYLFLFLEAYDFTSEGSEEIQEENKSLINASVLGLIFEKINGYKDGSFFTPGFITMYMCRETIRRAVVQKFEEVKGWKDLTFDTLYNKIDNTGEANTIINSLRICDPAVGSGHFLVSALNEIISVKNDLRILVDRQGKRLKEYHIEVVNDELIITDEDGELFEYHPGNKEKQRVQEALFHEKQTLIENCLFGVDINPNSVKICRLRLWIELLKNAYYKNETELETLPNIDINIKCGNSLVSRFAIDSDLKQALKKSKWSIDSYRIAVDAYRNAQSKDEKRQMENLIRDIKSEFRTEINQNDDVAKKLRKANGDLFNLTSQTTLIERTKKEEADFTKKVKQLTADIQKLEDELEQRKSNQIYEHAFEWRFEFPEVLDDDGEFVGFDVVIGNPPYIRQEELTEYKPYFQRTFDTYAGTADLYVYFVERGLSLLKPNGDFIYILPNKWMRAGYGAAMRSYLKHYAIRQIVDFGDLPVFEEATTYPCIMHVVKSEPVGEFIAVNVDTLDFIDGIGNYIRDHTTVITFSDLQEDGWTLKDRKILDLLAKIRSKGIPLSEYVNGKIFYGIKTGLNEAFVIDQSTRDRLVAEDPKSAEIIKPFLAGRDIKRYEQSKNTKFLILAKRGISIEQYPSILHHLENFKNKLESRAGSNAWYEIQASPGDNSKFEQPKIMYPDISKDMNFTLDKEGRYCINTVYNISSSSFGLLGYLNSNLFKFYFQSVSNSVRGGYLRFFSDYMMGCPIPSDVDKLSSVSQEIIKMKLNNISTKELEESINKMVYDLLDLKSEEIRIIENA